MEADGTARWQRRILRAALPAGLLLLLAWLLWFGLPFVTGLARTDVSIPSAVLGLVTSLILVATGYGYRRAMPTHHARGATDYEAGRPHPFIPIADSGLAAIASGGGFPRASGGQVDAVATTSRYQRTKGCAVPGCGKPPAADVHAPPEA